jgi:hypothetical protein
MVKSEDLITQKSVLVVMPPNNSVHSSVIFKVKTALLGKALGGFRNQIRVHHVADPTLYVLENGRSGESSFTGFSIQVLQNKL